LLDSPAAVNLTASVTVYILDIKEPVVEVATSVRNMAPNCALYTLIFVALFISNVNAFHVSPRFAGRSSIGGSKIRMTAVALKDKVYLYNTLSRGTLM
jgi:hypothetical protein